MFKSIIKWKQLMLLIKFESLLVTSVIRMSSFLIKKI